MTGNRLFTPRAPISRGLYVCLGIAGFAVVLLVWWVVTGLGLIKPFFLYKKENPPQFEKGDHRKGLSRFSYESLVNLEVQLNKIKERFGSSTEDLARDAQQYLLHYKFMGAVIPGFRNPRQVQVNLSAMDKPLTDEEFEFVESIFRIEI